MFGCCVWWIFSSYFSVGLTWLLSTNSHVTESIHVLVGLPMQRTSCQLLLWEAGFGNLKSDVSNCKRITHFYCERWQIIPESFLVLPVYAPKISVHTIGIGGWPSRAAGFIRMWQRTVLSSFGYWGQSVDLPLGLLSKLEFMQWKDVDRHTFRPTQICNSAINWLDYGNSFSGIQTGCL